MLLSLANPLSVNEIVCSAHGSFHDQRIWEQRRKGRISAEFERQESERSVSSLVI